MRAHPGLPRPQELGSYSQVQEFTCAQVLHAGSLCGSHAWVKHELCWLSTQPRGTGFWEGDFLLEIQAAEYQAWPHTHYPCNKRNLTGYTVRAHPQYHMSRHLYSNRQESQRDHCQGSEKVLGGLNESLSLLWAPAFQFYLP